MSDNGVDTSVARGGGPNPMQVLVVEDSAIYRKLIADHLQSWGFGTTTVESGAAAWGVLEQADSPKLVLLDWVLPDMDGIELCRRLRQAGGSRHYVYVILLTSKEAGRTCSRPWRRERTIIC